MKKQNKKLIWIPVTLVLVGLIVGLFFVVRNNSNKDPVYVYCIGDGIIGISDYYESYGESYGLVTTDQIQTVYLSDTQTVTEIKVTEGQSVKKGDVLFTYDTTLTELQLQRKDLEIQQMEINLANAQEELKTIKSYVPISYKSTTATTTTASSDDTLTLSVDDDTEYQIYSSGSGSGTGATAKNAKYCWLRSNTMVDEEIIEELFTGVSDNSVYVVFTHTKNDAVEDAEISDKFGVLFMRTEAEEEPEETEPDETEPADTDPTEDQETETDATETTEPAETETPAYSYSMSFFEPTQASASTSASDVFSWNSGYTSTEIATMQKEKEEEISTLTFEIKVAKAEYKIMQKEADDGEVLAEFDGVVQNLLDAETAEEYGEPLMRVSGGGAFYIEGTVSELELDTIYEGQEVEIVSWNTGETYLGYVSEIGKYPADSDDDTYYYYSYSSSSNVSYYPYTVYVDGSANLQDGFYVSMSLAGDVEQGSGLYLDEAFILTEDNTSYVYVRNEEDVLEKREVVTGKTLWGSYVQICSGLSADDYVAFPYGRTVKEGAPTAEGDWDTLYGS